MAMLASIGAKAVDLTGVYGSIFDSGFLSVHQSGNTLLGIALDQANYGNNLLVLSNGQYYKPGVLMKWGYGIGQLSADQTTATITGVSTSGACYGTYTLTVTGATSFSLALVSYTPTASGAAQGITCSALAVTTQNALQSIGGSMPFTKMF